MIFNILNIQIDNNFQNNNENLELCVECKGKCCKNLGCHFSPKDFKAIDFETLKNLIEKGYISIDWWEGDVFDKNRRRTLYLRIRNKDANIVDPSWGGQCMLLTEHGCSLPFNERPMGGRGLIPSINECIVGYSKEDCCKEWYIYQDLLEKLVKVFS